MSRKYCTITEVEDYMSVDITVDFESKVETWIEWMTEYIEIQTGRVFVADTSNSERVYEVDLRRSVNVKGYYTSPTELVIDEFVNTSTSSMTLKIGDDTMDGDEFLLYPATVGDLPKTRLVLKKGSGYVFVEGEQNIKVEAKWGYSIAAPGDIKFATIVLVSGMINNSWSSEGEMKSVTMGRYTMVFKDQKQLSDFDRVKEIISLYTKPSL